MTKVTVRASAVLLLAALAASGPSAQTDDAARTVTEAQYERWKAELSNWGRWGADDEIGALNLVTPAKRLQAVALVADGFTVSLAGDANTVEAVDNPYPYEHEMIGISSDRLAVRYHGHLPYAPRRAGARQRRRRLLQRLRAGRRCRRRERSREELHPQPEERHRDPRRPHRHPAAQGRALSGAGNADLRRGPRGVGGAGGRARLGRRRAVRTHRRVGAPRGRRPLAPRPQSPAAAPPGCTRRSSRG